MSTSLAEQLQRLARPQTTTLDRGKKRASLLFDPKEAAGLRKETVYEIGIAGLEELIAKNSVFEQFTNTLFSFTSKEFERSIQTAEDNKKLDRHIRKFLLLLSPYFLLNSTYKTLEWLIYRYSIHEYNKDDLLMLVFPYHETNIFTRVVQLIKIKDEKDPWFFLKSLQKSGVHLAKTTLLNHAATDPYFIKFVSNFILEVIKLHEKPNVLMVAFNFYCSVFTGAIEYSEKVSEPIVTQMLPSLLKGTNSDIADFRAASYVIIARLVTKCVLSDVILDKFLQRISNHKIDSLKEEAVLVYLVIYQSQIDYKQLPEEALGNMVSQTWLPSIIQQLNTGGCHIYPFLEVLLKSLVENGARDDGEIYRGFLVDLLNQLKIDQEKVPTCLNAVLDSIPLNLKVKSEETRQWLTGIVEIFEKQYPESFDKEIFKILSVNKSTRKKTLNRILKNGMALQKKFDIIEKLYHSNSIIRANAIEFVSNHLNELRDNEKEILKISLEHRLRDDDVNVVKETLTVVEKTEILDRDKLNICLIELLNKFYREKKKWMTMVEVVLKLLCVEENSHQFAVFLSIFPILLPKNEAEIHLAKIVIDSKFFGKCAFSKNFNWNAPLENIGDFPCEMFKSLKLLNDWEIIGEFQEEIEKIQENLTPLQIYTFSLILNNLIRENSSEVQILPFLRLIKKFYDNCKSVKHEKPLYCILDNLKIAKNGQLPMFGFLECILDLISKVRRFETVDFSNNEFLVLSCEIFYNSKKIFREFIRKFNDFISNDDFQTKIEFMLHFQIFKNTRNEKILKIVNRELENCENSRNFFKLSANFVPFLLILLKSPHPNTRKRTMELAEIVVKHCENTTGSSYKPLIEFLLTNQEEILLDHSQLPVVISNFASHKGYEKISVTLVEFTCSPEHPWYILSESIEILTELKNIGIFEKLVQIPIGLLEKNLENYDEFQSKIVQKNLERFDENVAGNLKNSEISKFLISVLSNDRPCLDIQGERKSPCLLLLETMEPGFIASLNAEMESTILDKILEISTTTQDPKIILASNKLFKKIILDLEHVTPQLVLMRDARVNNDANKKRRMISMIPTVEILETLVWKKGVRILEVVQNKKKLKNIEKIVKIFFEILKKCLDFDEQSAVEYPKQLLLSGILHFCKKIQNDGVTLPENAYNVEVIVQCIRATPNPQTHYHALLVLAYLAEINPTQVLHHIMAIFTFMGSSVLRHDDSYSFQLITKILDTIIPIITEKREIVSVLRVFVTALLDVPEHRRKFLYVQLLTLLKPHEHLHEFLLLVFIQHVIQSEREKTKSNRRSEIAVELVLEFEPDVIFTGCIKLVQYLRKLPVEFEEMDRGNNDDFEEINELTSGKQFRHFKYTVVVFVNNLISSDKFVEKIALLHEEALEKLQVFFKDLIVNTLQYVQSNNPILEKFLNTNVNQAQYWKAMQHQTLEILDGINALLTPDMFVLVIKGLMTHNLVNIKKRALDLLNSKLQIPAFIQECQKDQLHSLVHPLLSLVENIENEKPEEFVVIQTGLLSLKLIVKSIAAENPENYVPILEFIGDVIKSKNNIDANVLASLILCLAELCVTLRARAIQCVPNFMPSLLKILKQQKYQDAPTLLCLSVLTVFLKILESLSQFLSPYLKKILCEISQLACIWRENSNDAKLTPFFQKLNNVKTKIGECIPPRILIPVIEECYDELYEKSKLDSMIPLVNIMAEALNNTTGNVINSNLTELTRFFMKSLDFRNNRKNDDNFELTSRIENEIINAVTCMVLKLSETSFRPLFYKIFDWATRSDENERIITFYNLSSCLSRNLKSLFVLFAGHFIGNAAKLLESCNTSKNSTLLFEKDEKNLFLLDKILDTLLNIFKYSTTKFINKERFEILMQPIVDHLENNLGGDDASETRNSQILTPCIIQFAVATSDDSLWKQMNYQILLKLRNGNPKIRLWALNCLTELVKKLGDDFLPLLPETIPFLSELLEDEEEIVEKNCHKSIQEMEKVLGENLQKYF